MSKKGKRRKRILTVLLCWALCTANILSLDMTAWANELPQQELMTDKTIDETGQEQESGGQEETPESGTDETEEDQEPETSEEPETPEESEEPEEPEIPTEPGEEEDGVPQEPGEEIETEVPEENPEEAEMDGETAGEIDGEEESPISTMADLNSDTVPEDAIAGGSYTEDGSDITWYIDKKGKLVVAGSGEFMQPYPIYSPWYQYREYIKTAQIKVTGMTDASKMFYGCSYLTKVDLSGFDTSQVTNMNSMFRDCGSLTSLDVSGFDTSHVTDMMYMFIGCGSLTSLDVSGFDTSQVTNMEGMFWDCNSLTSLDVSNFETSKVTRMGGMFDGCKSLTSLDVSGFDTSKATCMGSMFSDCNSLTSLDLSSFDTSKVTDMSCMFQACESLTSLDLSGFDISEVTDMSWMFTNCFSLTSLDVSGFDTSNVWDVSCMFTNCNSLTSLDLSKFDVSHVTDMEEMFGYCRSLTSLDLSGFDTSRVTNMEEMFKECDTLTSLDVSGFDTSQVTNMEEMFMGCDTLTSLDVSGFDTSQVTNMSSMFDGCISLISLDLSGFDTSQVTNMHEMFGYCGNLTSLDLSNFDTSKVTDMGGMFQDCKSLIGLDLSSFDLGNVNEGGMSCFLLRVRGLNTIYTPKNLHVAVNLGNIWYQADGTAVQELPQNLDYSIILTKSKPTMAITSSITASKKKTAYLCGETVSEDDITVIYCNSKGEIIRLTTGFTTNAAEIDMTTPGKKILTVTYVEPGTDKVFTAEIELTVTLLLSPDSITVTLPTEAVYVYNGYPHNPVPVVTLRNDSAVLKEGTDYKVSYSDNIDAGAQAAVTVEGIGNYSGKMTAFFVIERAKVTIKAADVVISVNDTVPEAFDYEPAGFFNKDEEKVTGVSFLIADMDGTALENEKIDTSKLGTYQIILKEAQVGANYILDTDGCLPGILSIAEERIAFTVTFDMMGHGTQIPPIRSVKAGSLVEEPEQPLAEGFLFTGWYKDRTGTKAWNFVVDTVQENTTLYARWISQTAQGGVQIREIEDQTYTGSAIKPTVVVYAADGKTLLKSGKDYTVKYYNNIKADQVDAAGGTYNSLDAGSQEGVQNRFDSRLPYVEIKGKGNHEGTVYRNFHIDPASISDAAGNPATGFTLKYSDQLATNTKKEQKPFSSLKYKKAMKTGEKDSDFLVTLSAIEAYDGSDGSGEQINMWTAAGNKENKWNPAIPKGYYGTFRMTVEGTGNYRGKITKTIYVTGKNNLLRNTAITLGKNQKNMPYNGGAVTLTPGYYDSKAKKYYRVNENGSVSSTPEGNGNDLFTVKAGSTYLVYGRDYTVNYVSNRAVGTAAMTLTGKGSYRGSKSVTFKITGKAFKASTIDVKPYNPNDLNPNENDFKASMPYTGSAVTQNKVTLTTRPNAESDAVKLDYGRHYSISYKNNIKKGTATMTFTATPESGYSGSFKKTFKIGAVSLADAASVAVEAVSGQEGGAYSLTSSTDEKGNKIYELHGTVPYTKEGAKPSGSIALSLLDGKMNSTGVVLQEGRDYTVSYTNHTVLPGTPDKVPTMIFKGKGNFTGSLKVIYTISAAELADSSLMVSAAPIAVNVNKAEDYQYKPKITVKDGKKLLGKNDYTVEYKNCSQTKVKEYLDKLRTLSTADTDGDADSTAWAEVRAASPCAVIKAAGSGYVTTAGREITVYLNIYETKLTGSNVYVVVSEEAAQTTYHGERLTPAVAVYYGNAQAVKAAKKDKVTAEEKLTGSSYGLKKLAEKKDAAGDYTLTYGANVTAGKNKGSVTVSGSGLYGGDVTVKFTIRQRNVYQAP